MYGDSLRGYGKDTAGPGQRCGTPVRIADDFISKQLKIENADFSTKYMRQLGRNIEKQNYDRFKTTTNKNEDKLLSKSPGAGALAAPTTQDIKNMLNDFSHKFTKQEMYFRK